MAGCRSLTPHEIENIKNSFTRQRDRTLFVLGLRTGLRISELLSIKIGDVYRFNKISDRLKLFRNQTKGKYESKEIMLHEEARTEIEKLLMTLDTIDPEDYLFKSRKGPNRPIGRMQAHCILKQSVNNLELMGKIAFHSTRKTLAEAVYKKSGHNLLLTQKALHHSNISSTVKYLEVSQKEANELILTL